MVEDHSTPTAQGQTTLKDFAIIGTVTGVTLLDLATRQPAGSVALPPGDATVGLTVNPGQGLVFVAAAGGGFKIVDIRDPARPTLLGGLPAADAPGAPGVGVTTGGIAQDGRKVYLTGTDGLMVVTYDNRAQLLIEVSSLDPSREVARDLSGARVDGVFLLGQDPDDPLNPVIPTLFLKASLVGGPRAEEDIAKVRWDIRLDYRITVPGRPERDRFVGKTFQDPISGRIECDGVHLPQDPDRENCGWRVAPIESDLGQSIAIPWPLGFVGGGELRIQATPLLKGSLQPDLTRTAEADLDTGRAGRVFLNGVPYDKATLSPGSPRPRIEGELMYALSPDPQRKTNRDNTLARQGNATVAGGFRDTVIRYLENPSGNPKAGPILGAVGQPLFFRVIAYLETLGDARYAHFRKLQFNSQTITTGQPAQAVYPMLNAIGDAPPFSTDGGFGLMQLTDPPPTFSQIWHWRRNTDAAIDRIDGMLTEARGRVGHARYRSGFPANLQEWLRFETYQRYNGGAYWQFDLRLRYWFGPEPKLDARGNEIGKYGNKAAQIESSLGTPSQPADF